MSGAGYQRLARVFKATSRLSDTPGVKATLPSLRSGTQHTDTRESIHLRNFQLNPLSLSQLESTAGIYKYCGNI